VNRLFFIFIIVLSGCTSNQPGQEYQLRTDMYDQPSFRHNEDPRPRVEGTVQTDGFVPEIKDSARAAQVMNPYEFTRASADTARALFETYCSVCHGVGAKGDGPVAAKFQVPPDLTVEKYVNSPDGYIYSVIRNGRLIMPPYYENTTSRERWLIVSHLRNLQKQ
jgi:mono/diheme cytochrome c family protein